MILTQGDTHLAQAERKGEEGRGEDIKEKSEIHLVLKASQYYMKCNVVPGYKP